LQQIFLLSFPKTAAEFVIRYNLSNFAHLINKMNFRYALICAVLTALCACSGVNHTQNTGSTKVINLDTLTIVPKSKDAVYFGSVKHTVDIIHTRLELKPDWENCYLYGKATLVLKPYFYATNEVKIDAVGFDLNDVYLLQKGSKSKIDYSYNDKQLTLKLPKPYTRNDSIQIFIDYVAKPNTLASSGKISTSEDKGLFFINPNHSNPYIPTQLYSQSETQAASCWFPTIDAPNQRMTQEIFITVAEKYTTLSNGLLVSKTLNSDGTRTDYWKQSLPASPYLTMIAAGEFSVVKDSWHNLEISYYVEKNYAKEARGTFGKTAEMISFFSKKLGVDFPWEKYAQIVVRDYPGGSMENSSATLHGEFMNMTARERIDNDKEEFISHELFHQWFGDMVTCESWSNTPLNESFATYGEYLWLEHSKGKEEADIHHQDDLNTYFNEARARQVNMIRYDYDEAEDMFDRHSYEKGGRILHMLRNYLGDDAFFTTLNYYLNKHKFSSVELADLRLACEKISGEDLNWFFNQWFFASGHPELLITYNYNEIDKKETLHIEQLQDLLKTPLYKLPIDVEIYFEGKKQRHRIFLEKQNQDFEFAVSKQPDLVNVDADKMLLCKKTDMHTLDEWVFQYHNAPLYLDRYEAIDALSKIPGAKSKEVIVKALNDKNWSIRNFAISKLNKFDKNDLTTQKEILKKLALHDERPNVRANAIEKLNELANGEPMTDVYKLALSDVSFQVVAKALLAMHSQNPEMSFEEARQFDEDTAVAVMNALLTIFAANGADSENNYFLQKEHYFDGYNRYGFVQQYGQYLLGRSDSVINSGLDLLAGTARSSEYWWVRLVALQALDSLQTMYAERATELKAKPISNSGSKNNDSSGKSQTAESAHMQHEKIKQLFDSIKNAEKDKNLLRYYSN